MVLCYSQVDVVGNTPCLNNFIFVSRTTECVMLQFLLPVKGFVTSRPRYQQ